MAQRLSRPAANVGRETGRARVDPILSRSLILAGFGLGLMALGRALAATGGRPQGRSLHSGQSASSALWTLRDIPDPGVSFPPN